MVRHGHSYYLYSSSEVGFFAILFVNGYMGYILQPDPEVLWGVLPKDSLGRFASTTYTSCPLQHILLTPARAWIATETGWIWTDARPNKSTFAFCLQAVKNQGFSLPIKSQYSFWSEHFNWVPAKCQRTLNSWKLSCMLLKAMLIPETSSPVAELTLDANPAAQ